MSVMNTQVSGGAVETVKGSFASTAMLADFVIGYSDGQSGHTVFRASGGSFEINVLKSSIIAVRSNTFDYTGGLEKINVSGTSTPVFDTYFVSDDFNVSGYS